MRERLLRPVASNSKRHGSASARGVRNKKTVSDTAKVPQNGAPAPDGTPYDVDITAGLAAGFKVQPRIGGASIGTKNPLPLTR